MRPTRVDLRDIVVRAIAGFQPAAPHHRIILDGSGSPVHVSADAHRVEIIVGNLPDNAIKYSQRGARYSAGCRCPADWAPRELWPGKSEQQKRRLAEAISKDVMSTLKYGEESVSVAIEEVSSENWAEKAYKPDIVNNAEKLYKKPEYTM